MGSFNIVFGGLIAHIDDTGTRAVAVKHPKHEVILNVHRDHLLDYGIFNPTRSGLIFSFKLDKKFVLKGVPAGSATWTPNFEARVPSLAEGFVLNKDLDQTAKRGDLVHGKIEAVIEYSGGTIDAEECFPQRVQWSGSGATLPECIAKTTRYSVDPDVSVTAVTLRNVVNFQHFIRFTTSGLIWISNSSGSGNHFEGYADLASTHATRLPKADGGRCIDCKPHPPIASGTRSEDNVDCTNSRYP